MELVKIEKKIAKISTVYDTFKEDGKISTLEKDLLLGYIRELYELVLDISPKGTTIKSSEPLQVIPEPSVVNVVVAVPPTAVEKPVEKTAVEPIEIKQEVIIEPVVEKVVPKQEPAVVFEPNNEPVVVNNTAPIKISHEMNKLFTIEKAKDISERLAMSPISDISKAMSINDRMLILKELFGNDSALFNESITKLNSFLSFAEAKDMLLETVAFKYQWDNDEKLEKAEAFVKLISRKYQNTTS
jgi:hypothetical protein